MPSNALESRGRELSFASGLASSLAVVAKLSREAPGASACVFKSFSSAVIDITVGHRIALLVPDLPYPAFTFTMGCPTVMPTKFENVFENESRGAVRLSRYLRNDCER